jgi:hypothetical protein
MRVDRYSKPENKNLSLGKSDAEMLTCVLTKLDSSMVLDAAERKFFDKIIGMASVVAFDFTDEMQSA